MNILEHRFRASDADGHVAEGCTVRGDRAQSAMVVSAIVAKGDKLKNIKVTLGAEVIEPPAGITTLVPPRNVAKGDALALEFTGHGSLEIAGERVKARP